MPQLAYEATVLLGQNGGFEDLIQIRGPKKARGKQRVQDDDNGAMQHTENDLNGSAKDKKVTKRKRPTSKDYEGKEASPNGGKSLEKPVRQSGRVISRK